MTGINRYTDNKKAYKHLISQQESVIDLKEWTQIEVPGRYNCGLFVNARIPDKIIKCSSDRNSDALFNQVDRINKEMQLFPLVYRAKIINGEMGRGIHYVMMQKLDGSLNDFYRKHLFSVAIAEVEKINNLRLSEHEKQSMIKLFSMGYQDWEKFTCSRDTLENIINDSKQIDATEETILSVKKQFEKIKKFIETNNIKIKYETYMMCVDTVLKIYDMVHESIVKEIIKIRLIITKFSTHFNDNKYDNYGYILSPAPLQNDFRRDVPKIFGKYLYVYFLDWESGLDNNTNNQKYLCSEIIKDANNGLDVPLDYADFKAISNSYFSDGITNESLKMFSVKIAIDYDILRVLATKVQYDLSKFKHTFGTIDCVKGYVGINDINNELCRIDDVTNDYVGDYDSDNDSTDYEDNDVNNNNNDPDIDDADINSSDIDYDPTDADTDTDDNDDSLLREHPPQIPPPPPAKQLPPPPLAKQIPPPPAKQIPPPPPLKKST